MSSIDIKAKTGGDFVLSGLSLAAGNSLVTDRITASRVTSGYVEVSVPVSVVLIRPKGPAGSVQLPGTHFVETSIEHLTIKPSALSMLRGLKLGTVILEDLHVNDLDEPIREALFRGRDGVSCPVVTRWTNPRAGDAR